MSPGTARLRAWLPLLPSLASIGIAGSLSAQVDAESFARLGFNFSPPGAQSAALGGAYIALAKDATAAETNPAALTVLLSPEISFEFKGIEYSRTLPDQAGGGDFQDQVAIPSFGSVVYPTSSVSFAAFRHELVSYRNTVWSGGFNRGGGVYLSPFTSTLDMRVANMGGALAVRLGTLSVGASGGVSQLALQMDFPRYKIADYSDAYLQNRLSTDQKSSSVFANAGVLIEAGHVLTLGGVYKFRGKFDDIAYQFVERSGGSTTTTEVPGVLDIPDAAGAGIALAPGENVRLSVDAVYNFYSQLSQDVSVVFSGAAPEEYVTDDGLDIHGGLELLFFVGSTPFFLRGGGSLLAPSNTYYTGSSQTERDLWGTEPGDKEMRYSGGLGLVLGQRMAVDGAVVVSDARTEAIASVQIYLGG